MAPNAEQIIFLESFEPFGENRVLEFSHVSDAISDSGLKIHGNCVRLTAHWLGGCVSFLFSDEQWSDVCDSMKAITQKPALPDKFGKSAFAEIREEMK